MPLDNLHLVLMCKVFYTCRGREKWGLMLPEKVENKTETGPLLSSLRGRWRGVSSGSPWSRAAPNLPKKSKPSNTSCSGVYKEKALAPGRRYVMEDKCDPNFFSRSPFQTWPGLQMAKALDRQG